jgi:hypothetical protein
VGRPAASLLALLLLLPACGGSAPLSRAEYVRQADAVCARYARTIAGLGTPRRPREIVRFTSRAIVELDRTLEQERDLKPPARLEPLKRRWLAAAARVRTDMVAVRRAARANDFAAIEAALEQGVRHDDRSNALARELGLRVCSKP